MCSGGSTGAASSASHRAGGEEHEDEPLRDALLLEQIEDEELPEGASREARLRMEALSVRHQLTHLPKNPFCPACQIGKLSKPHRRRRVPDEDIVVGFGVNHSRYSIFEGRCEQRPRRV